MEDPGHDWMTAMRRGDFTAAYRVSDRVLATRPASDEWRRPRHEQLIWTGAPFDGKRVLVRCYRGLGDTLMYARFLPRLEARVASLVTWVQPPLLPLLSMQPEFGEFLPLHDGTPDVDYDLDMEVMEIAHALRATPCEVVPRAPYLALPAQRDGQRVVDSQQKLRVGLVWSAADCGCSRSMSPSEVAPLAEISEIEWHVLQQGVSWGDYPEAFGAPPSTSDIIETAYRMTQLDLVISVDSMPVHLAGAFGIPVWVLLPEPSDWRWQDSRLDSPWYPTARLFRQHAPGDWHELVHRVGVALQELVRSR